MIVAGVVVIAVAALGVLTSIREIRHRGVPIILFDSPSPEPGMTSVGNDFAQQGTIAADTSRYPFGTVMEIPGYGRGRVEDRGSAIKGPKRLDLYYRSHGDAMEWGRQFVDVTFYR